MRDAGHLRWARVSDPAHVLTAGLLKRGDLRSAVSARSETCAERAPESCIVISSWQRVRVILDEQPPRVTRTLFSGPTPDKTGVEDDEPRGDRIPLRETDLARD
jgi:hypothetical protein